MNQPNLFGFPEPEREPTMICPTCQGHGIISATAATSRTTDPTTSTEAGRHHEEDVRRFSRKSRQAKMLDCLHGRAMTAQEAAVCVIGADAPISALEGCRRRVSDLLRAGFIEDSGARRQNPGSPDESIVWCVTDAGHTALTLIRLTGWSTEKGKR